VFLAYTDVINQIYLLIIRTALSIIDFINKKMLVIRQSIEVKDAINLTIFDHSQSTTQTLCSLL
jgi:hypothetical protein